MVQPTKPPISIRLPEEILAELESYMRAKDIARNAAVNELVREGLARWRMETKARASK